ncbi:MAG: 30S ribosomal protein S6--L-glutamate ligase [Proteobacteria bacterium]|nr:30S ribosomal protein S6--L-glutamate ligase [Pseudomonadota bacterium]
MRIAILSRGKDLYSTRRLKAAAENRGHYTEVIDYLRCHMNITAEEPSVLYKTGPLPYFDAIIPRIGTSRTFYGAAVVRQFETIGAFTVNSSLSITHSRDKLRALQLLSKKNIGLPITGFAHSLNDVDLLIKMVGGPPLVIKLIEGTQGVGVVLAETLEAAYSVIQAFMGLNANIIIQEFIQEAQGADVRCFVIGDKVVAAIKRQAEPGEFRSNIHQGGVAQAIKPTRAERETAIRAAKIMGLRVAGVDMLRSNRGPLVMEVNSSPGLEGIETATEKDIATLIIKYIEKHAKPIEK